MLEQLKLLKENSKACKEAHIDTASQAYAKLDAIAAKRQEQQGQEAEDQFRILPLCDPFFEDKVDFSAAPAVCAV